MSEWWRRHSIRMRLASAYSATVVAILVVYGLTVWVFVANRIAHEVEHRLGEDLILVESMLAPDAKGQLQWRAGGDPTFAVLQHKLLAEVWSADGVRLLDTEGARLLILPSRPPDPKTPATGLLEGSDRSLRVFERPLQIGDQLVTVRILRAEARLWGLLEQLLIIGLLGLPLWGGVVGLIGYWLSKRALSHVARLTELAQIISAKHLSQRLPVANAHDELGQLSQVFNATFARLESSFTQLQRFTADVSHELRTPLTSLRTVGEIALHHPRDPAAYREAIGSMLEDVERLTRLLDTLLMLSRADAERVMLTPESTDLGVLTEQIADQLSVLAEDREQTLTTRAHGLLEICVDPAIIRLAITNLIDNAIMHGRIGGTIAVTVLREANDVLVRVHDDGAGVPEAHRHRIFERFYRVDTARSRAAGGTGLGLAIARWAAEAHGGTIELEPDPTQGASFLIRLPICGRAECADAPS